ncbi:MAG: MBL fold metallo-hydrolase [Actinomycetota bacterium]
MLDAFTWYKQAALKWKGNIVVHIDPWGVTESDEKADLILITHAHFDHYNPEDLPKVTKDSTIIVAPEDVATECDITGDVRAVKPGQTIEAAGLQVTAVPAYNVAKERLEMHPRDNNWVGYILDLSGTRTYLAGDTDHIPEMADIRTDLAFVPIGGTYTMDVDEAVGAIKEIAPRLAVPYHFGFVVGSSKFGDDFVRAIAPIEGVVMKPVNPFEME